MDKSGGGRFDAFCPQVTDTKIVLWAVLMKVFSFARGTTVMVFELSRIHIMRPPQEQVERGFFTR